MGYYTQRSYTLQFLNDKNDWQSIATLSKLSPLIRYVNETWDAKLSYHIVYNQIKYHNTANPFEFNVGVARFRINF